MPEYILPHGDAEHEGAFNKRSAFVRGYVECIFFTDNGPGTTEEWLAPGFEPSEGSFPADCSTADIPPEEWMEIESDCAAFQKAAAPLLALAYQRNYSEEQAGRDFWFSRNGHGVGFWDRAELSRHMVEKDGVGISLGDALSELCGHGTDFPNVDSCLGDDGKIYLR